MEHAEIADTLRRAGQSLEVLEQMYEKDPAVQTLSITSRDLVACIGALLERVEQLEAAQAC
jgi:hypothetical protein